MIAGVGIHPFGRFPVGYRELGVVAVNDCLADAGVAPQEIDITFVANVGAEMAKGHNVLDRIHRGGNPIINVEAACASSGSALFLANNMVASGAAEIVLCLGVEKAPRGFIGRSGYEQWQIESGLGVNPLYFAIAAQELLDGGEIVEADLADVAVKNHRHSVHNPNAMYRKEFTRDQILDSKMVCAPLTLLMLCAPNEGAAAAIVMTEDMARRRGVEQPIRLRSIGLVSRGPTTGSYPPRHTRSSEAASPNGRPGSPTNARASGPRTSTSWSARTPMPHRNYSHIGIWASASPGMKHGCCAAVTSHWAAECRSTRPGDCCRRASHWGPLGWARYTNSSNNCVVGPDRGRWPDRPSVSVTSWARDTTPVWRCCHGDRRNAAL